jgi:hypothetical protein
MSLYFFRVQNGRYSGAPDNGVESTDREAAWVEMTKVCGDLVGGILRGLKENSEWSVELLDETKKPISRVRLLAEPLG